MQVVSINFGSKQTVGILCSFEGCSVEMYILCQMQNINWMNFSEI